MRGASKFLGLAGLVVATSAIAGCDGCTSGEPAKIEDRVWVTNLPADPRASMKILWIFEIEDAGHVGGYVIGSQFRNRHERFQYHPLANGLGRIELLQDRASHRVIATKCDPTDGFDMCMQLHGDPMARAEGAGPAGGVRAAEHGNRYFSREEWERDASDGEPRIEELLAD